MLLHCLLNGLLLDLAPVPDAVDEQAGDAALLRPHVPLVVERSHICKVGSQLVDEALIRQIVEALEDAVVVHDL